MGGGGVNGGGGGGFGWKWREGAREADGEQRRLGAKAHMWMLRIPDSAHDQAGGTGLIVRGVPFPLSIEHRASNDGRRAK